MNRPIGIDPAAGHQDMEHIRVLFVEYQEWLEVDLCFQGFDKEISTLPGAYGPPGGRLLLARDGDAIAGGVGFRPLSPGACEMKRLYVRPPWRGRGLGRRLAQAVIDDAAAAGYGRMCLDTLPRLAAAIGLYRSLGFVDTQAYYENPLDGVTYMALSLEPYPDGRGAGPGNRTQT